jgi:hypothetical protein
MSDLAEFKDLSRRDQRDPCAVAIALNQLDEKDRKLAQAAFDAPGHEISNLGIIAWFEKRGIRVARVNYHRSRKCRCYA